MPKTPPPWDEPDPQRITKDDVDRAIKKALAEYDKQVLNREKYVLHAQLHQPGDRDPINLMGTGTDGSGFGAWPQMKTPLTRTIASNAITLDGTVEHYLLQGEGNAADFLDTITGGTSNKFIFLHAPDENITIRDGVGNIRVVGERYFDENDEYMVLPLSHDSEWAIGYYNATDGLWYLTAFFIETPWLVQHASPADIKGTTAGVLATQWPVRLPDGSYFNTLPNTQGIVSGAIEEVHANVLLMEPETGSSDDLTSILAHGATQANKNGDFLYVLLANSGETITLKHNTGASGQKILCDGDTDITMSSQRDCVFLMFFEDLDTGNGAWMARRLFSNGGADLMLAASTVTISSGEITVVTRPEGIAHYIVSGEGAADDVLETINGGTESEMIRLEVGDEVITVANSGNISFTRNSISSVRLAGDAYIDLYYSSASSTWIAFAPNRESQIVDETEQWGVLANSGDIQIDGALQLEAAAYTIASGKITDVDSVLMFIDPESGTADDLLSIEPLSTASILIIYVTAGNTITLKHLDAGGTSAYKLQMATGGDLVLNENGRALFIYDAAADSGNGAWNELFNNVTSTKTITATHTGNVASTSAPLALIGPMPQGGVIVSHACKKVTPTAMGATAWIGDIHLVAAADANTSGIGTTIFGTKPTITNTNFHSTAATLSTTAFAAGDWFYYFTDQVGTSAGNIVQTLEVLYNTD